MKDTLAARVRFGAFELDLRAGELRLVSVGREAEGRSRVLLPEQPFRLLLMLVEREGNIATREEIQKKLWPNDTLVEFGHSIHAAINKLRKALGDSSDEPKYIETIPRRGYRLIVPVEWIAGAECSPGVASAQVAGGAGASVRMQPDSGALTGGTVSHYRVLDIIGGGGMGVVYRAEDLKLGRRVALKVLPEELGSDPQALERFDREARAASSLDHPNICPIYEFGEHEGRPFMVMQLLEGQTLRDRLAAGEGALPLEELLDIGIQVSDGLQAAHERGIIHRDIKPANIFLTNKGVCKILDFGLAKLLEVGNEDEVAVQADAPVVTLPEASGASHLTRAGVAMGTEGYMSPEQLRHEKLDARTDLFSFGLVLYEMATGHRAFSGETAAIVHDAILNSSPVPVCELNSTLPVKLVTTIDKALEKDRKLRYQHAPDLRMDLQRLAAPSTVAVAPPAPPVRRWQTWTIAISASLVLPVMALLIGFNVGGWRERIFHHSGQPKIQSLAVLPLENFSQDPGQDYFADGMTEALITDLAKLSALRVISRTSIMQYKGVKKSLPQISKELGVDAAVEGSVQRSGNRVRITVQLIQASNDAHLWADSYERDLGDVLALQDEVAQDIANKIRVNLTPQEKMRLTSARPVNPAAYEAYLQGQFFMRKGTIDGNQKGLESSQKAVEIDPGFASGYAQLARSYLVLGNSSKGVST